jgi:peptidoglycan/xylan/chitin deacetylase (PgdA/CDA1 family)
VFNVGTDQEISISALAELVRRATGGRSSIVHVPYAEAYEERFEDLKRRIPDLQRVGGAIAFRPKTPIERIVERVIAWEQRANVREAAISASVRRIRWRERIFGLVGPLMPQAPVGWAGGAQILLYHQVVEAGRRPRDPFAVSVDEFDRQIAWVAERYTVVPVRELVRRLAMGEAHGLAAVTFDDGDVSTVTRVLPVLRARGVSASVFVDTGRLNGSPPALRDEDLRMLADAGVEIGGHTVTHPDLTRLDSAAVQTELTHSRERLREVTGAEITGFAHPFGRHNARVSQAVAAAGYAYACTCRQHRTNFPGDDPYRLTRLEINATDGPRRFAAKLRGRYARLYATWYRLSPVLRGFLDDQ